MTGRHRRVPGTPARRALLGTVPLVGTAGLATALLTGMAPEPDRTAAVLPGAAGDPAGATASRTLPGMGEHAMDAVAGARDATVAREAARDAAAVRVSTVAEELRRRSAERAERARAAGDAELAAYLEQQADRQEERDRAGSRAVVPSPSAPVVDDPGSRPVFDDRGSRPVFDDRGSRSVFDDPGEACTSDDVLDLGPLTMTGPDGDCGLDPWIADQLRDD